MPDDHSALVVVGASAGGVEALQRFVRALPADFPAPILVVLHASPTGRSYLPEILTRAGRLPAAHASDGERLSGGRIFVAPPDFHLGVVDGRATVTRGPRENGHRPAIDVLFRTAATGYEPRRGRRPLGHARRRHGRPAVHQGGRRRDARLRPVGGGARGPARRAHGIIRRDPGKERRRARPRRPRRAGTEPGRRDRPARQRRRVLVPGLRRDALGDRDRRQVELLCVVARPRLERGHARCDFR